MKKAMVIVLFALVLQALELKEEYAYTSHTIYTDDILLTDKHIALFEIPKNTSTYLYPTHRLIELLSTHGLVATSSALSIRFVKKLMYDEKLIREDLQTKLKAHYPTIVIDSLVIRPNSYLDIQGFKVSSIGFSPKDALHARGTFWVEFAQGNVTKKIFFEYEITAHIEVVTATSSLKINTLLTPNNTTLTHIGLSVLSDFPIYPKTQKYVTTRPILSGKIITQAMVKKLPATLAKQRVSASSHANGVEISFDAIALEDGEIESVITIQDQQGNKHKAKVVGINLVEVL